MELFVAAKYLHIVSMFFAVALALSGEIVLRRVAATRDPHVISTAIARVKPIAGNGSTVLFLAGIAFGFVAALTGQLDLLRPWLIASYVAVIAAFALGLGISDPWLARLEKAAAETGPGGGATAELNAIVDDSRARFATWALVALIALLVFLMVVKPLG